MNEIHETEVSKLGPEDFDVNPVEELNNKMDSLNDESNDNVALAEIALKCKKKKKVSNVMANSERKSVKSKPKVFVKEANTK